MRKTRSEWRPSIAHIPPLVRECGTGNCDRHAVALFGFEKP
jgi:hypothetical protein